LRPLLEEATKYIPRSKWRETPVALKATAGLRLLSNETATNILEKVCYKLILCVTDEANSFWLVDWNRTE